MSDIEQRLHQLELDVNMLKAAVGRSEPEYPVITTTPDAFTSDLLFTAQELRRERDEYLDLLDEAFGQSCGRQYDDNDCCRLTGWLDDNASSTLRSIADALVKAGRLERHPDNKRLYRRTK